MSSDQTPLKQTIKAAHFKNHPGVFWDEMPPDQREALFDAAQAQANIAVTITAVPNIDGDAARKLVAVLTEAGEPLTAEEIDSRAFAMYSISIEVPDGCRRVIYNADALSIFLNAMRAAGVVVQTASGRWKLA
jgi:hypothetical protein